MAGYTVQDLKQVENQGPKFGLDENDIQLRMARNPLGCESCGISYLRLGAGWRVPFGHKHKQQEEVYVLVNGSARIKVEEQVHDLKQWDAVRVHRDTMRGLEAGDEGAEFLLIGAPNTGPGDAEMVQDWWND